MAFLSTWTHVVIEMFLFFPFKKGNWHWIYLFIYLLFTGAANICLFVRLSISELWCFQNFYDFSKYKNYEKTLHNIFVHSFIHSFVYFRNLNIVYEKSFNIYLSIFTHFFNNSLLIHFRTLIFFKNQNILFFFLKS